MSDMYTDIPRIVSHVQQVRCSTIGFLELSHSANDWGFHLGFNFTSNNFTFLPPTSFVGLILTATVCLSLIYISRDRIDA